MPESARMQELGTLPAGPRANNGMKGFCQIELGPGSGDSHTHTLSPQNRPPNSTPGPLTLHPVQPCTEQLSAPVLLGHYFHYFITFLGIQIRVTAPDASREKWCLPPLLLQPNELPFFISKSNERQTT